MSYNDFYDYAHAARKKQAEEKYNLLKQRIDSKDEQQNLSEFSPALEHIRDLEIKIENQDKELRKYREFFISLRDLIPEKKISK